MVLFHILKIFIEAFSMSLMRTGSVVYLYVSDLLN